MRYQVKKEYLGKVKLEDAHRATLLDANTPQEILAKLYGTVLGKGFIEQVAVATTVAQTQDDAKVGQ